MGYSKNAFGFLLPGGQAVETCEEALALVLAYITHGFIQFICLFFNEDTI